MKRGQHLRVGQIPITPIENVVLLVNVEVAVCLSRLVTSGTWTLVGPFETVRVTFEPSGWPLKMPLAAVPVWMMRKFWLGEALRLPPVAVTERVGLVSVTVDPVTAILSEAGALVTSTW